MSAASVPSAQGSWSIQGHATVIEYSCSILSDIDRSVVGGFNRFRRGGVEVGGVLFGEYQKEKVRILAYRPLTCEYALGPNFVLSDSDQAALGELLRSGSTDPDLQGLIPVGWYHSHTRTSICLSDKDIEIFDRYFPESWQIALVLRPANFALTRAGFFFREAGGYLRTESSHAEFSLESSPADSKVEIQELAKDKIRSQLTTFNLEGSQPKFEQLEEDSDSNPATVSSARSVWAIKAGSCAGLLCFILFGVYFGVTRNNNTRGAQPLSLLVEDRAGQLRIAWDPSRWEARSTTARLEISEDATKTAMDLDTKQLRSGSVTYARKSGTVLVRMQAADTEEWATFIAPSPVLAQETKPVENETAQLKLDQQAQEINRLARLVETLNDNKVLDAQRLKTIKSIHGRPFLAPNRQSNLPTIPTLEPPSVERFDGFSVAPPLVQNFAVSAAIPTSRARTGTLIWTGHLAKKGMITIDGNRPSIGDLTGEVPGIPVRIHVHPAELTQNGLTVYNADAQFPVGYSEPPGPQNGWNKTLYVHDAQQVKSIVIVEPPSAANDWKRMVLRIDQRNLTVILVGWEVL